MLKCSCKDCNVKGNYLYQIDNGRGKVAFCPNHAILYAFGEISEKIEKYPSEVSDSDLCCELCGNKGYVFKDNNHSLKLCSEHLQKILTYNLSPKEFFALYEKYPDMYLLHEDFYDVTTGKAIQPIKI